MGARRKESGGHGCSRRCAPARRRRRIGGKPACVDGEFRAGVDDLVELGEEEEDLRVYRKGHRSRLVAPTGTNDSTVPVGATNRDRWPGRGGAWCCRVAPGSSIPVGSTNRDH